MASFRKAINEKCKDCTYDPLAGGHWRMQVSACSVTRCPLHPYRPLTESSKLEKSGQIADINPETFEDED